MPLYRPSVPPRQTARFDALPCPRMSSLETSRSAGGTFVFGALALALLGLAAYLAVRVVPEAAGAWLGVGVFGLLGVGSAAMAAFAKKHMAPCPSCAALLRVDEPTDQRLVCQGCTSLVALSGGQLAALPADTVTEAPDLGVLLLPRMKLPAICVACGGEATRALPFAAKDSALGASLVALVAGLASGSLALAWASAKVKGGVPYCDTHGDAHEVVAAEGTFVLWVRSWRFIRAVGEANSTMLHTFWGQRPKS